MIECWLCDIAKTTTPQAMAWHVRLIHQPTRPVRHSVAEHAVASIERNQGLLKLFADGDSAC